ncbi:hypothetical protein GCM10011322_35870 [Salinarimonas ramus]|uniref:Amidase domain-containing protein n=1 Tax=Salinarimonas ramus TaxID=690164 RepID=A0A917V6B4_9HYPH|nr:hypothetical protein GCM10011322_35870 [Salinarimonas ramus]
MPATAPPTIDALHARYEAGESPLAILDEIEAAIAALDDPGIFLARPDAESMRATARALPAFDPARFPLWGVPFAVKDNIDVAGLPTSAACPAFAYVPERTAPVVERLLAAGALLVGKTNLDQFATGLVGVRTPHPVPRNAFDKTRVPGGSSSGSAVAVAQNLCTFSLGTDTAGSGRVPAGLNNLVGLKPTVGALSTRGVVPACRSLDCVSIFALSIADARRAFDVARGFDVEDPFSRALSSAPASAITRVAIPRPEDLHFFGDAAAARAWEAGVARLAALGVAIVEHDVAPLLDCAKLLYDGPFVAERRAAIGGFFETHAQAIHPVTRAIVASADRFSAVDAFEGMYALRRYARVAQALFEEVDALAVPTAPLFPTLADLEADPIVPNSRLGTYTNFVNLLDLAALAVPGPFRADGLPAGTTLVAPAGHDSRLADLGARLFPGVGGVAGERLA